MPTQRRSKKPPTITTKDQSTTPLRRSQRLVDKKFQDSDTHKPKFTKTSEGRPTKSSKKSKNSGESSTGRAILFTGSRKSLRLGNGIKVGSILRRSPRLALQGNTDESKKSSGSTSLEFNDCDCHKPANVRSRRRYTICISDNIANKEKIMLNKEKGEVGIDLGDKEAERREGRISKKSLENSKNSNGSCTVCPIPVTRSRKSLRLGNEVNVDSSLRRSPSLALLGNNDKSKKNRGKNSLEINDSACPEPANVRSRRRSTICNSNDVGDKEGVSLNKAKGEVGVDLGEEAVERSERSAKKSSVSVEIVLGLQSFERGAICERHEDRRVSGKRKRAVVQESSKGSIQGWTREQEMALQNAYFAMKPTPQFWKKVSKLVPGKSAQECFDKIHSERVTPTQPLPRSRANQLNSSPLHRFSLSASKLLEPSGQKIKKMTCNNRRSHLTYKTVRQLLQKHIHGEQDNQADLFSVLEPNSNLTTQDSKLNVIACTPPEKRRFLQKCHDKLSSCKKRPLSRLGSCAMSLVSPPVLKQVKNRALHEKYIDQLHCREAKRKAACAQAGKSVVAKENRKPINHLKIDVVRAAKNALISDATDVINQLKSLQTKAMDNFCDYDDGCVDSDSDNDCKTGL